MIRKSCAAWSVKIWMAGNLADAERVCREFCYNMGFCVTVTPTNYIYTGGEQSGFVVGMINYARFPSTNDEINKKAGQLAELLAVRLCQKSYTIETPVQSFYYEVQTKE